MHMPHGTPGRQQAIAAPTTPQRSQPRQGPPVTPQRMQPRHGTPTTPQRSQPFQLNAGTPISTQDSEATYWRGLDEPDEHYRQFRLTPGSSRSQPQQQEAVSREKPAFVLDPAMPNGINISYRFIPGPTSSSGKVAYVLFNGVVRGMFYNWESAALAINATEPWVARYRGYPSIADARSVWTTFENTGQTPSNVTAIASTAVQAANAAATIILKDLQQDAFVDATDDSHNDVNVEDEADVQDTAGMFMVVLDGRRPGVYPYTGSEEMRSTTAVFASLHRANQFFVTEYMANRVRRT